MLCFQSFLNLGVSGTCIQRYIVGNVFLYNVYKRFLINVTFFIVFNLFNSFYNGQFYGQLAHQSNIYL